MNGELFMDLFDEEVQAVGKAVVVLGVITYLAKQAAGHTLLNRDEVQYAIEAHLPQGYDRSIVAARSNQALLTKGLMAKALGIDAVRDRLRGAVDREMRMAGLSELFSLSLAGILSAAHVHSLTVALHVIKNTTLALVHVLRKREERQGSCGRVMVSKLRSWWSGGTRNLMIQTVFERLQQHMEASPFAMAFDDDVLAKEVESGFSVEALLQIAVPRVVASAVSVVRDVLSRRAPHAFSMAGVVTGQEMSGLLVELCVCFESSVVWSDWLAPLPRPTNGTSTNGNSTTARSGVVATATATGDNCSALELSTMPVATLKNNVCLSPVLQHDCHATESFSSLPHDEMREMRAAREEEMRNEEMALNRATGFFQEIIHSASFNEICIAYATEMLECTVSAVADLRCLRSYDASTDSVKLPPLVAALENHRLLLFDRDFDVRPYLRLLCEETVRATCRSF